MINIETNRIPFRADNFSLDLWKDTFRSWPKTTKGWKNWFLRVSGANEVYWAERKLDQCIRLSITDMEKNESMMIIVAYFCQIPSMPSYSVVAQLPLPLLMYLSLRVWTFQLPMTVDSSTENLTIK